MIKVSVYIVNRNYSEFLKKCIKSVLNQNFRHYEILIIDDNSSDNSLNIINTYKKIKNCRIFLRKKRFGLIKNINFAIKKAKGRFILRLDADDYLRVDALKNLFQIISKNRNAGLIFPDYYLINKNSKMLSRFKYKQKRYYGLEDFPAHGACSMINLKKLKKIGGYSEKFDRQDGYYIWLLIILNNLKILHCKKPLFYYRKHGQNLSKDIKKILKARKKILDHFLQKKYKSNDLLISKKIDTMSKLKKL